MTSTILPVFDLRPPSTTQRPQSSRGHRPRSTGVVVHDTMMGLDSPSYSRKGSFGNDKMLKVFDFKFKTPGPGSYNCRYGILSFPSLSARPRR